MTNPSIFRSLVHGLTLLALVQAPKLTAADAAFPDLGSFLQRL
jgi:hypothetical protein